MHASPEPILSADDVVRLTAAGDSAAVIERLAAMPDPLQVADLYSQAVMDAYWKKKDLVTAVLLGRAGLQHSLISAISLSAADPEKSKALRGKAKAISYNIASFTWPGWDEPGIDCSPTLVAIGFDAAKTNVRLANELNRGDLPMSRGLWMLAGHRLASGDFAGAAIDYESAGKFAAAAGSAADEGLCAGFAALSRILQRPDDPLADAALQDAIEKLKSAGDDGKEFIGQIETARRVFERRK